MKTIKSIIFCLLVSFTFSANGQNNLIGLKGGVNWTNATATNFPNPINYKMNYAVGITYDFFFKGNFKININALYEKRGFTTDIIFTNQFGEPTGEKAAAIYGYNYVSIPLKIGYQYGNSLYFFSNIGITPAILTSAVTITPEINYGEIYLPREENNMTKQVNKFDFGGIIEVGGGYKVTSQLWFDISLSYQHSITSITNSQYFTNSKIYHNGLYINGGLKYALTK